MVDVLAQNLSEKAVMGTDGVDIGTLENITMDFQSGRLANLLVAPDDSVPTGSIQFETADDGRFRIPVGRVQAVKDYIVVQR